MELMDDIRQTAQELGTLLGEEACVSEYLSRVEAVQQDPVAVDLETRFRQAYQKLVDRKQAGLPPDRDEQDAFLWLNMETQMHPSIESRDLQEVVVRIFFAEIAQRMSTILGFSYTDFAL